MNLPVEKRIATKEGLNGLGTIGGALTAILIFIAQEPVDNLPSRIHYWHFTTAAIVSGVLSVGAFAIGQFLPLPHRGWLRDYLRELREHEIQDYYLCLNEFSAGPLSDLARKYSMRATSPQSFFALERDSGSYQPKHVVGFLVAYRLRKGACERIEAGTARGPDFTDADLTRGNSRPYGLYVSFMWALDRQAKASLLASAESSLILSAKMSKSRMIYGRPTTRESLNLAKKWKFTNLDGTPPKMSSVCKLKV